MRKLLFSILALFPLMASVVRAASPFDWNYVPITSYTEVATPGAVLFTSAAVHIVGVTISSPAVGSLLAFYRSNSPTFTNDLATQTMINTSYGIYTSSFTPMVPVAAPIYIPLFEMKNTSYTFIHKVGNAKITIWLRYPPMSGGRKGTYPGLPSDGSRSSQITYEQ